MRRKKDAESGNVVVSFTLHDPYIGVHNRVRLDRPYQERLQQSE